MVRAALVALALLLAAPSGATARTLVVDDTGRPLGARWQAWVDSARLPAEMRDQRVTVAFTRVDADRPYGPGNEPTRYDPAADRVILDQYARARDLRHELGHVYDARFLTDARRRALTTAMGLRGDWWQRVGDLDDPGSRESAAERFADLFAVVVSRGRANETGADGRPVWSTDYGARVGVRRMARLRRLLGS